ncbi:MAG: ubiquinol oxidase subunit II [Nevskiaceae bacterium]|nr:MAG: ubiquinol oxidase subunit II [Nevskiaceae bacterium]
MSSSTLRGLLLISLAVLTSGCSTVVLSPAGDVARQQAHLVVASTVLMLLIIVPVMVLTGVFAWRYRASNQAAKYEPDWNHSTSLELVIWSAPLLIIIALGALTWIATHTLDPFRPVSRVSATQPLQAEVKPLRVQAVALDWKWLFIYPDYGIATVNEMAAPVDRPIDIQITSSTVMNAFYVPALAGMIYAMPAMETQLHAVINKPGNYEGFSANYSGAGFSGMRFRFYGVSDGEFDAWIKKAKDAGGQLSRDAYLALEKPSEREPVRRYAEVMPGLYDAIVNLCVSPGKMCQKDMAAIDARGGLGLAGVYNVARLAYDKPRTRGEIGGPQSYVLAMCAPDDVTASAPAFKPVLSAATSAKTR